MKPSTLERARHIAGRWVPVITVVVAALTYGLVTYLAIKFVTLRPEPSMESGGLTFGEFDLAVLVGLAHVAVLAAMVLAMLSAYLFLPGLVGAILALPIALTWRNPKSFLALRRFGMAGSSRALRAALREHVCPAGHVYTLADEDIKVPWFIRYPVVLTQLVFLHFRQRCIRTPAAIQRFLDTMDVRWARNVNWVVSRWKTFPLRSVDEHWQTLVIALSEKVDAILVEISQPSENLAWEIRQCRDRQLLGKMIFLSTSDRAGESRAFLSEQGVSDQETDKVVFYDSADASRLPALLERRADLQIPIPRGRRIRAQLAALTLMVGPILWLLLLGSGLWLILSPYLESDPKQQPNMFTELVAKARIPASRTQALEELSALIERGTQTRPDAVWLRDFEATVVPLYREVWHTEPARQRQIINDLWRSGSPAVADLWRDVINRSDEFDPKALELALVGIVVSRSSENVPDLIALLGRASGEVEVKVLECLGVLGDPRAVTALLERTGQAANDPARSTEVRKMERLALQSVLLGQEPVWPLASTDGKSPIFRVVTLGARRGRMLVVGAVLARSGLRGPIDTNVKHPQLPLYDKVKVTGMWIAYPAKSRLQEFLGFPGDSDFLRGMVDYGAAFDAAILVVSAGEAIDPEARDHVAFAAEVGIPRIAVFVNTGNKGPAGVDRSIEATRLLLREHGYESEDIAWVSGAIPIEEEDLKNGEKSAGLDQLMRQLETWPLRKAAVEKPVRFPVKYAFDVPEKGTVVIGYPEQGTLRPNQQLSVVPGNAGAAVAVLGEYRLPAGLEPLRALWVRKLDGNLPQAGYVLATPRTLDAHRTFESRVYFIGPKEGGRSVMTTLTGGGFLSMLAGTSKPPVLFFRCAGVPPIGTMQFNLNPTTGAGQLRTSIASPVAMEIGQCFRFRDSDGRVVGSGVVTRIVE